MCKNKNLRYWFRLRWH